MSRGDDGARGGGRRELLERLADRVTADHALLATVVAAWVALYLVDLGAHPVRVWDESRYVVPARNMVVDGGWLDPRLQVNTHSDDLGMGIRLVKPPLLYWLQGVAMVALGVSAFAARLPTVLATLGCAVLVFHLGKRTYDRRAGVAGALAFLVFPGTLLGSHGGTAATPDTLLTLFGSLFVWFTYRGREDPRLLVPASVAAGLAVMTKGVAAGVFVFAVLPVVLLSYRDYLTRWTAVAVGTTTAIALPWHLYAYLTYGETFVEQFFVRAVVSRARGDAGTDADAGVSSAAGSEVEPLFEFLNYPYVRNALGLFAPPYPYWLPLFGLGVVAALALLAWRVRRDGRGAHVDELVVAWWALAVPLTFAVVGGNKPWYLIPMYVPGAVLLGHVPAAIADGTFGRLLRGVRSRLVGRDADPSPDGGASGPPADRPDAGDPVPDRSRLRAAGYVAVCVLVTAALAATYAPAPSNAFDHEQRSLGNAIDDETPAEATVYVALGETVPRRSLMALPFYADRTYTRTTMEQLSADPPGRYALVPIDRTGELAEARVVASSPENRLALVVVESGPA